ncbi:unnamed protein product [Moneuplotes crassus]|uniref:Uncharacterized protein n=1 Tax=Euplotes crassus TaxID=5936 RepID=A0AAD1Y3N8_EUPCR|nr:unnamed protein product [Moneuplotes crassus]
MDDLFGLTLTFDPLKEMLTNILKSQNELQIEMKLLKESMGGKAGPEMIEKTNSKVAWIATNTENQLQKLTAKVDSNFRMTQHKIEQNLASYTSLSGKVHEQQMKFKEFDEICKDLEQKSIRTDTRIDDQICDFENYKMDIEMQKWKENDKKKDNEDVSQAVVQKIEEMVSSVSKKVHHQGDTQIKLNDKIGDLETKVILLIQAAKNKKAGKEDPNLFDGVGEVVSAVDHLKEKMRSQYTQLTEFKEIEQKVEILNKFYLDEKEFKSEQEKAKEELEDRLSDMKIEAEKLKKEMNNLKEDRFKTIENQLVEKVDYSEFEATVNNIQNYFENNASEISVESKLRDSHFSKTIHELRSSQNRDDESDSLVDDEDIDIKSSPRIEKDSPPVSRKPSRDRTPAITGKPRPSLTITKIQERGSSKNVITGLKSPTKKIVLKNKKALGRKGPSFIPREAVRMKEMERKIKDLDDRLGNVVKNSKDSVVPIIEKRVDGIREEIENKASKLELKKLKSDVQLCAEYNKEIDNEITDFKKDGLVGEKGKKIEEEVSLTSSKLAQLEGKFSWLHEAHKELKKTTNDSLKASQPLMIGNIDTNKTVNSEVVFELKEEIRKLDREIKDLASHLKITVGDLKAKISEKVDERNLSELEDQLTTDMDQIIRSFNRRFAEKQDTKKSIRHIERQIRVIHETVGIGGPNFMNNRISNEVNPLLNQNVRRSNAELFGTESEVERSRGNPHDFGGVDPSRTFNVKSPDFEQNSVRNLKKNTKLGKSNNEKITVPLQGSLTSRIYNDIDLDLENAPSKSPGDGRQILENLKGHKVTKSVSKVNLVYPKDLKEASSSRLPEIKNPSSILKISLERRYELICIV